MEGKVYITFIREKITVHYPLEVNTQKYPAQRDNKLEEKKRGRN